MDGGWAPGDEGCEAAFADAEEGFVDLAHLSTGLEQSTSGAGPKTYLRGICFSLYDVQNTNVAARFAWCRRNHAILWLQQSSHDIQYCSFADSLGLFDVVASEGSVGGHEEVAARGGDKGSNNANKIVVHVAGIAEGRCAGRHHRRYLNVVSHW